MPYLNTDSTNLGSFLGSISGSRLHQISLSVNKSRVFSRYLTNLEMMAEEVGFEPTVRVNVRRFSRPVHSTTLPLLRRCSFSSCKLILKVQFCRISKRSLDSAVQSCFQLAIFPDEVSFLIFGKVLPYLMMMRLFIKRN